MTPKTQNTGNGRGSGPSAPSSLRLGGNSTSSAAPLHAHPAGQVRCLPAQRAARQPVAQGLWRPRRL